MPTAQKTAAIEQLRETLDRAAAIFLADFTGLDVAKMTDLRRKCRENGVTFRVVKNTLAIKATRAMELEELEPHFRGPTALAVSTDDPTSPARVLLDFQKEHKKPEVKLGYVDGRVLTPAEVKAVANLPSRDQLVSQIMQLALAPAQNFVSALNDVLGRLVRTVDAVRGEMEKGTAAPADAPAPTDQPSAEGKPADEPLAEEPPAGEPAADEQAEESKD
jgi:large subunit ribosomal protein L10